MRLILRGGLWKPESDEDVDEAMIEQEAHEMALARAERGAAHADAGVDVEAGAADTDAGVDAEAGAADAARSLPLGVLLLPILVPLLMIAFGAFAELLEFSNSFIAFLGNANFALFVGLDARLPDSFARRQGSSAPATRWMRASTPLVKSC